MSEKYCPRCKETKLRSEFGNHSGRKDGLTQHCRICHNERLAEYRKDNPKWLEWRKTRYWDNVESERQKALEYYERNKESRLAYMAEYHEANRDKSNHRTKQWREDNPEKAKASSVNAHAKRKSAEGEFSPSEWKELCEKYDYTCLCCGKKEPEIKLTPDHVVPVARGGSNYISNIQPLCMPCNRKKMTKTTDYRMKGQTQ